MFAITFLYNTSIAVAEGLSTITGINFTNTSSFNFSYNNSFIHNVEDPEYFVFTYRHDIEYQDKWYNQKAISKVSTSISNCTVITSNVRIGKSSTSYHVATNSSGQFAIANYPIRCAESYTTGQRARYVRHYNTMKLLTDNNPQWQNSSATWTRTR